MIIVILIYKLEYCNYVGSNTDSGSKILVYCKDTITNLYLAFIIRNLI